MINEYAVRIIIKPILRKPGDVIGASVSNIGQYDKDFVNLLLKSRIIRLEARIDLKYLEIYMLLIASISL